MLQSVKNINQEYPTDEEAKELDNDSVSMSGSKSRSLFGTLRKGHSSGTLFGRFSTPFSMSDDDVAAAQEMKKERDIMHSEILQMLEFHHQNVNTLVLEIDDKDELLKKLKIQQQNLLDDITSTLET